MESGLVFQCLSLGIVIRFTIGWSGWLGLGFAKPPFGLSLGLGLGLSGSLVGVARYDSDVRPELSLRA